MPSESLFYKYIKHFVKNHIDRKKKFNGIEKTDLFIRFFRACINQTN